MREAIDKLMLDFNKFLEENAVFKGSIYLYVLLCFLLTCALFHSEGAANLNDMKDMLASLPQYQEQREKVSLLMLENMGAYLQLVLIASQYGARLYGAF